MGSPCRQRLLKNTNCSHLPVHADPRRAGLVAMVQHLFNHHSILRATDHRRRCVLYNRVSRVAVGADQRRSPLCQGQTQGGETAPDRRHAVHILLATIRDLLAVERSATEHQLVCVPAMLTFTHTLQILLHQRNLHVLTLSGNEQLVYQSDNLRYLQCTLCPRTKHSNRHILCRRNSNVNTVACSTGVVV